MRKKKKAVGMLEAMIGSILIATTFVGLIATFGVVRERVDTIDVMMDAANRCRSTLNQLYVESRLDTWNKAANWLFPTTRTWDSDNDGNNDATLTVVDAGKDLDGNGLADYRIATITITY